MSTSISTQLLLQYPIDLPSDYDMGIIRTRVRTRGHILDDRAGLIAKAYCIREAGVDGSPVNQYAPFYLWGQAPAAADFLWGGTGFHGIIAGFGRPRVNTWIPAATALGGCAAPEVGYATVRTTPIPRGADLIAVAEALVAKVREREGDPGVHVAAAGINPTTWEAVEFATLGAAAGAPAIEAPLSAEVSVFTVLHISAPALGR